MVEQWRPVVGSPGYQISSLGRVRGLRGHDLTEASNGKGYLAVPLGAQRREYVHRLVAAAFLGDISGMDVDHLDQDRSNNRVENLEIITHSENMRRRSDRQTHCVNGHLFAPENTYRSPSTGRRQCRQCRALADARRTPRRPMGAA